MQRKPATLFKISTGNVTMESWFGLTYAIIVLFGSWMVREVANKYVKRHVLNGLDDHIG